MATLSGDNSDPTNSWWILPPESWREKLLSLILRVSAVLGFVVFVPSFYLSIVGGLPGLAVVDTIAIVVVLGLWYAEQLPYQTRALGFALICFMLGVTLLVTVGPVSQIYLFGFSFLTTLLLGFRAGIFSVALNAVALLAIGFFGVLQADMAAFASEGEGASLLVVTLNFLLVNATLTITLGAVIAAFENTLRRQTEALAVADRRDAELVQANSALELEAIERQRVEAVLRSSEARFRELAENVHDFFYNYDPKLSRMLYVSPAYAAIWGRPCEGLYEDSQDFMLGVHPDDRPIVEAANAHKFTGESTDIEYRIVRPDGSIRWVRDQTFPVFNHQGELDRIVGTAGDITERKQSEIKLFEQATLIDHASDAILVCDLENKLLFWNHAAETIYGWTSDEVHGRALGDFVCTDRESLAAANAAVVSKGDWTGEMQQQTKQGGTVTVLGRWTLMRDQQGGAKSILLINTDITGRKALELQMLRSQRMESIGTLTGGIAHDLNNILSPILMSSEMLSERMTNEEDRALVEMLRVSGQRGAELVKQLLLFARGVEGERHQIYLDDILNELQRVIVGAFPRNIEFQLVLQPDAWSIRADVTQIHQVLMNLCVNARDAMPAGGRLSLTLTNVVVDEVYAGLNLNAKPGPYLVISVEDTGEGISQEVQAKIFEPFFSTKDVGKGTGLGLSTVYSIVRDHGGFISLYSEPGKGAKFKLYFPAITSTDPLEAAIIPEKGLPTGSGELILLIDDEANIRDVAHRTLEHYGYRVLLASNGAEALKLFALHGQEIAAVITDMNMPIMDGPPTIVALKAIDPNVRIIVTSGLAANEKIAKTGGSGVEHFVSKPYTAESILTMLHNVLAGVRKPTTVAEHGEA